MLILVVAAIAACAGSMEMPARVDATLAAASGVAAGENCDEQYPNDIPAAIIMSSDYSAAALGGGVVASASCSHPVETNTGWSLDCESERSGHLPVRVWVSSGLDEAWFSYDTEALVSEIPERVVDRCTWTYDLVDIVPTYCGDDGAGC